MQSIKKTVCVIGVLLLLISFNRLYAQCDPTPTVNLKYVSGNGTNCTFNYDFSISYSGSSYKSFQFSVSVNGGAPSTITGCLSLTNPITTGTTNNFTAPCANGTRLALTITYGTSAGNCGGGQACTEAVTTITLPVKITWFQFKWYGTSPCLRWTAEAEENIASYNIEYSSNGTDFSDAGIIKGLNRGVATNYSFCDPQNRLSGFYRLKINETSGKVSYSEILKFSNNAEKPALYPNPVQDKLYFSFGSGSVAGAVKFTVFNMTGTAILSGNTLVNYINVSSLPPGMYYIELQKHQGTNSEKISFLKK